jgi:hypothetical protein
MVFYLDKNWDNDLLNERLYDRIYDIRFPPKTCFIHDMKYHIPCPPLINSHESNRHLYQSYHSTEVNSLCSPSVSETIWNNSTKLSKYT